MSTKRAHTRRTFLKTATLGAAVICGQPLVATAPRKDDKSQRSEKARIGIYTRPWDQHDYRVALDAMVEAGFRYAGLMTTQSKSRLVVSAQTTLEEAEGISQEVKRRGLQVLSVYGGGIPVQTSLEAGVKALERLIDCCAVIGSETLLMGGVSQPGLYDRYYEAIAACVERAAAKKLQITLKPHGGLNATGPQCRKAIARVGHPSFRLWYDPGNIYYYSNGSLDPVDDAGTVDGIVTGMCVKDYRHPKEVLVTPGAGKVDFKKVFQRLAKGGFTPGPLVIETLSRGDRSHLISEARKARLFVERLVGS